VRGKAKEPLARLAGWLADARMAGLAMPEAATLATASRDGTPSARTVSVKRLDESGVVFGTSLASRKSAELDANPRAALVFWWEPTGRQARVEGRVELVSRAEAEAIWEERARANRIATIVSRQGAPLEDRAVLRAAFAEAVRRYGDGPIPCPEDWGAYRVLPDLVELWEQDEDRLVWREEFRRVADGAWVRTLLQP
jgi:pyridoxamine-phosphate oxidase